MGQHSVISVVSDVFVLGILKRQHDISVMRELIFFKTYITRAKFVCRLLLSPPFLLKFRIFRDIDE